MLRYGSIRVAVAALLGLAVLASPTQAQRPLILVGGLNMPTIDSDLPDIGSRNAIFAGIGTAFAVAPLISISPFVTYTQRGYQSNDGEVETNIAYIDVPVFLGVSIPIGETFALGLSAGPRISFNISCEYQGDGIAYDCSEFPELQSDPKSLDYGFMGDAGLSFAVSPTTSLGIGAGYDMGLNDVFEDIEGKHRGPFVYAALSFVPAR